MQFENAIVTQAGRSMLAAAHINDRLVFTRFLFCGAEATLGDTLTDLPSPTWGDGNVDNYATNSEGEFIIYASASNLESYGYAYGFGVYGYLESEGAQNEKLVFVGNHNGVVTYVNSVSGAATRFHLCLTVHYTIDSSIITINPNYSGLVTNSQFQALLNRTVTTHSATSESVGDDQFIRGVKEFNDGINVNGKLNANRLNFVSSASGITSDDIPILIQFTSSDMRFRWEDAEQFTTLDIMQIDDDGVHAEDLFSTSILPTQSDSATSSTNTKVGSSSAPFTYGYFSELHNDDIYTTNIYNATNDAVSIFMGSTYGALGGNGTEVMQWDDSSIRVSGDAYFSGQILPNGSSVVTIGAATNPIYAIQARFIFGTEFVKTDQLLRNNGTPYAAAKASLDVVMVKTSSEVYSIVEKISNGIDLVIDETTNLFHFINTTGVSFVAKLFHCLSFENMQDHPSETTQTPFKRSDLNILDDDYNAWYFIQEADGNGGTIILTDDRVGDVYDPATSVFNLMKQDALTPVGTVRKLHIEIW